MASWMPPFYAGAPLALTTHPANNKPFEVGWFAMAAPEPASSNVPRPSPLFATAAGDFRLALIGNDVNWALNHAPEPLWRPALRRPNGVL